MKPMRWLLAALPLLGLPGCTSFLDPSEYEDLPALEDLDYALVGPSAPFLIWELREGQAGGGPHRVLARGGTVHPASIAADLLLTFNATSANTGFDPTCLPGYCYKYFVTLQGTTIELWDTKEEARAFLGSIETQVEAALIAKSHGYYWELPKETAAIRDVGGGFELAVLDLVRTCAPIQYDRVLVRVSSAGELTIVKREVWEVQQGVCI